MVVKVYAPPTLSDGQWTPWQHAFSFAAADVAAYEYDEPLDEKGSFRIVLPFSKERLAALTMNSIIQVVDDRFNAQDWLICESISYDGRQLALTGHDCRALLSMRQTIPPQGEDHDMYKAGLGNCVRRLLFHNCTYDSEFGYSLPEARRLPIRAPSASAVTTVSSYMTAYDDLGEVITELCRAAGVGYRITGANYSEGFAFQFIVGADRSINQNDRGKVIFSVREKNVTELSFEHDVQNLKNCIYAKDSNGTVQTVHRDSETSGLSRRECAVSVNATVAQEDYFRALVLDTVKDNIETHSYTLSASAASGYNNRYFLGDTVTVRDVFTGSQYSGMITGAGKSFGAGQCSLTITIGKPKQKLLDRIVKNLKNGVI